MTLLRVENLKKVYADGTKGLDGIDLIVRPGEFVAIIGPSGAGKSTLLRCLNRLVEPSSGTVILHDTDVTRANHAALRRARRQIGMIFQGYNLIHRTSVLGNVLNGRLGYVNPVRGSLGLFTKKEKETAGQILQRVGLGDFLHKRADELSGGQQQRVGIARALAQTPELILADEPIASLDPASSELIMGYLHRVCQEDGIACICNLHQVDVAKKYATKIVGIHKGKKVFEGPPERLDDETIAMIYNAKERKSS